MDTEAPSSAVELSTSQSWELLREAVVGRLAVLVDDQPDIFPVNYLVDHGSIVFRTAQGTKLLAAVNRKVAFEVDSYDPLTGRAWTDRPEQSPGHISGRPPSNRCRYRQRPAIGGHEIGATLLMKAPNAPPTTAAAKAATTIKMIAVRSHGPAVILGP